MAKTRLGKLPPRFRFILNSYKDFRLSKCPRCQQLAHMRKFALLIHIDKWGLLALGKTCRYCTPCELIIAHQDELEDELVHCFERLAPDVIGNPYLVLGTVDKKWWKESLDRGGDPIAEALDHVADFKRVLDLTIEGGGWMPVPESKAKKRPK
jgi:hypothetical protein